MLILECVEKKKRAGMAGWPEWSTAHFLVSVATGLPEPCVATGYSLLRQCRLGTRPGRCARGRPARSARTRQRHTTLCPDKIFVSRQGLGGDWVISVATEVSLLR